MDMSSEQNETREGSGGGPTDNGETNGKPTANETITSDLNTSEDAKYQSVPNDTLKESKNKLEIQEKAEADTKDSLQEQTSCTETISQTADNSPNKEVETSSSSTAVPSDTEDTVSSNKGIQEKAKEELKENDGSFIDLEGACAAVDKPLDLITGESSVEEPVVRKKHTARVYDLTNDEMEVSVDWPEQSDRQKTDYQKPLVRVYDTATDDGFLDDNIYHPESPSDTVTVTIKFSSETKGVILETETRKTEKDPMLPSDSITPVAYEIDSEAIVTRTCSDSNFDEAGTHSERGPPQTDVHLNIGDGASFASRASSIAQSPLSERRFAYSETELETDLNEAVYVPPAGEFSQSVTDSTESGFPNLKYDAEQDKQASEGPQTDKLNDIANVGNEVQGHFSQGVSAEQAEEGFGSTATEEPEEKHFLFEGQSLVQGQEFTSSDLTDVVNESERMSASLSVSQQDSDEETYFQTEEERAEYEIEEIDSSDETPRLDRRVSLAVSVTSEYESVPTDRLAYVVETDDSDSDFSYGGDDYDTSQADDARNGISTIHEEDEPDSVGIAKSNEDCATYTVDNSIVCEGDGCCENFSATSEALHNMQYIKDAREEDCRQNTAMIFDQVETQSNYCTAQFDHTEQELQTQDENCISSDQTSTESASMQTQENCKPCSIYQDASVSECSTSDSSHYFSDNEESVSLLNIRGLQGECRVDESEEVDAYSLPPHTIKGNEDNDADSLTSSYDTDTDNYSLTHFSDPGQNDSDTNLSVSYLFHKEESNSLSTDHETNSINTNGNSVYESHDYIVDEVDSSDELGALSRRVSLAVSVTNDFDLLERVSKLETLYTVETESDTSDASSDVEYNPVGETKYEDDENDGDDETEIETSNDSDNLEKEGCIPDSEIILNSAPLDIKPEEKLEESVPVQNTDNTDAYHRSLFAEHIYCFVEDRQIKENIESHVASKGNLTQNQTNASNYLNDDDDGDDEEEEEEDDTNYMDIIDLAVSSPRRSIGVETVSDFGSEISVLETDQFEDVSVQDAKQEDRTFTFNTNDKVKESAKPRFDPTNEKQNLPQPVPLGFRGHVCVDDTSTSACNTTSVSDDDTFVSLTASCVSELTFEASDKTDSKSSNSSSSLDVENPSDFESAIEEEFWKIPECSPVDSDGFLSGSCDETGSYLTDTSASDFESVEEFSDSATRKTSREDFIEALEPYMQPAEKSQVSTNEALEQQKSAHSEQFTVEGGSDYQNAIGNIPGETGKLNGVLNESTLSTNRQSHVRDMQTSTEGGPYHDQNRRTHFIKESGLQCGKCIQAVAVDWNPSGDSGKIDDNAKHNMQECEKSEEDDDIAKRLNKFENDHALFNEKPGLNQLPNTENIVGTETPESSVGMLSMDTPSTDRSSKENRELPEVTGSETTEQSGNENGNAATPTDGTISFRTVRAMRYKLVSIAVPKRLSIFNAKDSKKYNQLCQGKQKLLAKPGDVTKGIKRSMQTKIKRISGRFGVTIESEDKPYVPPGVLVGGFVFLDPDAGIKIPLIPKRHFQYLETEGPSKYFRGISGVINNAYKMSNFILPKVPLPSNSSSHQILHACNRLVTQSSPARLSPTKEFKYGVMSVDDTVLGAENASTTSTDLSEMLDTAREFLNCSRFDDAEKSFLRLYQQIQEKPEDNGNLLVETLTGLADICIRRSRMCRSNPLEWQWLCMHAIALLQYTTEFCDSELESELDNQQVDWFQEQKHVAEVKCRPLEDAFNRALYNCLKHDGNFFDPFQSFSLPNTPVGHTKRTSLFPLSSTMPQYLVVPGMRYRVTDQGLQKQSADDSHVSVDWLAKFQDYCKDRLQTKDSKEVTEKILKASACKNDDDTESVVSDFSHGSLDWDHGDLQGIDEVNEDLLDDDSPVKEYSFAFELASSEANNDGWDFFLNKRKNCNIQSVVQISSGLQDSDSENENEIAKEEEQQQEYEREQRMFREKEIVSPLHEHSISLTLSRSYCRLADKLVHEEEYRKAEAVYEKILAIIDEIQDGTAGMLRFSARIMKNLGTVKSKQGKASSGLVLLNRALQTYRDLQEEEANFEIAIALIELGNGYIVGKNNEDSVFDDVIIAICEFFEKDSSDEQTSSTASTGSGGSQMSSSLRSDAEERNVEEAVMCYTEAISLLDKYEADQKQVDMFAKAVMRLGDCYFMQKEYDQALDCYEKSLGMFRSNNILGKDSLMENAHVMCMLGVCSFMLHVYPRAASVFEMALHMVKCAYGFNRTFLHGMLLSLSGITYYKMKNYHKCVSMCYQAYETYCDVFGEEMPRLGKQRFWLVCQTLYVMGNSYNILNLPQKAVKYLTIARSLMKASKIRERRQFMRVLQILGDAYFAQYDYKAALQFYNEALEYGECESQISFDEVFDPNSSSDEMTIHNHLVSKSAEAHISMQQYQNAVHYLEQAHDMQEVMGEDIKEDLINTLNQLGQMHSMAGDVEKAIESYKESLEVFREIHDGKLGPEMCSTLGNLAAICYVKACISDDVQEELDMILAAEQYFQEAMKLNINPGVSVKYANFLYSQANYEDAIMYLQDILKADVPTAHIVYGGLEKVTLPDLLQDEVDAQEEICLPSSCLGRYLLLLCYKSLGQNMQAEENLILLMEEVIDYDIPLLHSLLGYAMMEMKLFEEAARCFLEAAYEEEEYHLAAENYCICIIILLYKTLQAAVENIWLYYRNGKLSVLPT